MCNKNRDQTLGDISHALQERELSRIYVKGAFTLVFINVMVQEELC